MRSRVDDLTVDVRRREVRRGGDRLTLPDLTWRLFEVLVERAPDVVTFEELARRAWRRRHVSPDALTQRVKLLRQALGDDPKSPRYVGTVRGVGYQLIAPAVPELEMAVGPRLLGAAAVIAILGLAAATAWMAEPRDSADEPERPTLTAAVTVEERIASARDYLARADNESNERAARLFQSVLAEHPNAVDALVGLSFVYGHRATKYDGGAIWADEAEDLARNALAIKPGEAEAWHALGLSLDAQGRVDEALRAYQQAIAANPDDRAAMASAAYLLQIQGRLHEALVLESRVLESGGATTYSELQIATALHLLGYDDAAWAWLGRAEDLKPDNPLLTATRVQLLLSEGRHEEVVAAAAGDDEAARGAGLDVARGEALFALARYEDAIAAFRAANGQRPDAGRLEGLALSAWRGDEEAAGRAFAAAEQQRLGRAQGDRWPDSSIAAAAALTAAGDVEGALERLDDAIALGYRDWRRLSASPFFASLRGDPRFAARMDRVRRELAGQRALVVGDSRLSDVAPSTQG